MLTKELVQQAIQTSHKVCSETPGGCVHADALAETMPELQFEVMKSLSIAIQAEYSIPDTIMSCLNHGIHIGYRLHELETGTATIPTPKAKVN